MPGRPSVLVRVALVVALLLGPAATSRAPAQAAPVAPEFARPVEPFAAFDGQVACDPTAKPGALALRDLLLRTYPNSTSLGIVRDCAIGGQSEHKEGRAFDWGVNAADPTQLAFATDALAWLLATDQAGNPAAMARRLGIMYIIWNRQVWKAYAPDKGWQPYSGPSPHTDHVHFSLSLDGGNALTSWYEAVKVPTPGQGYWLPTDSGVAIPFAAPNLGSLPSKPLVPVVGMVPSPTGDGYWHVAADGGIFAFGDATYMGSTGGIALAKPIVGMAATPSGQGYWLVASDGGIFSYGDAKFLGSTGGVALKKPIVGMAATPSGTGYWLVASDGGIFAYGDAKFFGSTGAITLTKPVVGMASAPAGSGYWLVAADGGVFTFGTAKFLGSTGSVRLTSPIRAMAATATGLGYWMVATDGGVFAFGDASYQGSAASRNATVVGIARYK